MHNPPRNFQSPSILGISNPNSPFLSNPSTPKLPSQNRQHDRPFQTPPPPTTSSTLLSLLPPLSRAQNLLLQMSTLATKLFQVSPSHSRWLSSFRGSLPNFLPSQSQTPPPSFESNPSSTEETLALFSSLQTQLLESVSELEQILNLQDAKKLVSRQIKPKDSAFIAFANKIKEAEHVLDTLVDDYSHYRKPKRHKSAEKSFSDVHISVSAIMSLAHRISYTTFAPPGKEALPPAPQEMQMRASQLFNFTDLDIGLPKEMEKDVEVLINWSEKSNPIPAIQEMNSNSNISLPDIQKLLPPNLVVPPGWQVGMPVELPADFPIPVDPINSRVDPITVPGEPITVPFVQLDIPQDESDYSSDYTSDEEDDEV